MALTRDFMRTMVARAARDPAFATALHIEAETLLRNGESETARLILRDILAAGSCDGTDRELGKYAGIG